jgi:hypothetical protein
VTKPIQNLLTALPVLILAACSSPQADAPPPEEKPAADPYLLENCGPVTDGGFCRVGIGMTLEQARAAFPQPLVPYGGDAATAESCFMVHPEGRPDELAFMFVNGKVARVDIFVPGFSTSGIQVGTPEEDVLQTYGDQAKVFPNKYDDTKHDVIVDTRFLYQIIFETDGMKVLSYRAGVLPPVGYVERCG